MWVILLFSGPLCPGTPGRMLELWVAAVMAPQTYLLSDLNPFLTNHCQKHHMLLSILANGWFQVHLYILLSEWKEWTTEMWESYGKECDQSCRDADAWEAWGQLLCAVLASHLHPDVYRMEKHLWILVLNHGDANNHCQRLPRPKSVTTSTLHLLEFCLWSSLP